jgi:2-polyprenyl-6-hydroxyphenyl methylase/3-demethylubiquinone-9 3-methyltransferase
MSYYSSNLSGERLRKCYEVAPPSVARYLICEIEHVKSRLKDSDTVLESGCGYGRVAFELAKIARRVVGIDTSVESLALARELGAGIANCEFLEMDAADLKFPDNPFDAAVCVQNGICAFGVDKELLFAEALRVTRPGGRLLFSSYASDFWQHRLEWFETQAWHGLVGEIDYRATGNGTIVCKDGFRAGAMEEAGFRELCGRFGLAPAITVVDESSIFCEAVKPKKGKA